MLPGQTKTPPLIGAGWAGGLLTITEKYWGAEEPHPLLAVTVISPPLIPAVALIKLVDDVPDQPEGRVQVYEVAPEIGLTL